MRRCQADPSTGAPTAGHQACPEPLLIMLRAGLASSRRRPVNSAFAAMNTNSPATEQSRFNWRSEGVLLAILPIAGSLVALVFEAGFLSFFEVPFILIQIDFLRIVIATFFVGMFSAVVFLGLLLVGLIMRSKNPLGRALAYPLIMVVLFSPILYFIPATREQWALLAVLVLLAALACVLPPLFSRKGKSYLTRLEEQLQEEEAANIDHKVQRPIANAISEKILAPLGFLVFGTIYVFALGRDYAESRTVHYALQGAPEWVLVTAYGDTLLLKNFDSRTHVLGAALRLQKPADPTTTILVRRNIGRLTPAAKDAP